MAQQNSDKIESAVSGIGNSAIASIAGVLGLKSAFDGLFDSIKMAAQAEQTEASFTALIGNAEEAKKVLADIREFSLSTPFQTPELIEASKQLVAFGTQAKDVVPTMRMLGEVSAAVGAPLKDLSYLWGTLKQQNRAFTIDIKQFAMRGIPIYRELAKVFGLIPDSAKEATEDAIQELDKMVEAGSVTFKDVKKAFEKLTGPGGQFFGQLDVQSKTLMGLFSNMKEEVEVTMTQIGKFLIEGLDLKEVVLQVSEVNKVFNAWLKGLDEDTKRAIIIVAALVGVFVGLAAAVTIIGSVFAFVSSGMLIWVGIATAGIGLIALWIYELGGLSDAWRVVKRAATDFWNFIRPVLPAIGVLLILLTGYFAPIYAAIALMVYYWRDVVATVKDFYAFISPTLRATWSLVKVLAFAIRDGIASAWEYVVKKVQEASDRIQEIWTWITGGQTIDWSEVKNGIRDFVYFMEYAFKHIDDLVDLAWASIKYGAIILADALIQNIFGVMALVLFPALILFMFVTWDELWNKMRLAAKQFGEWLETFLINLLTGAVIAVDKAARAIRDAIENFKIPDLKQIREAFEKGFQDAVDAANKQLDKLTIDAQKAMMAVKQAFGDVEIIKKGDIPIGIKIEGLTNLKNQFEHDWRNALKRVNGGFKEFKENKELQFQMEDAADVTSQVMEKLIMPFLAGRFIQDSAQAGTNAGAAFADNFVKKFEKVEATLANSAEAISRLDEYKAALPSKEMLDRTRQPMVATLPPTTPNSAEIEAVDYLKKIHDILDAAPLFENRFDNLLPANLGGVPS